MFSLPFPYTITITRLKFILVRTRHDHVIDLQHHPTQLRRKLQLLLLPNERVYNEGVLHVVVPLAHAIDSQLAPSLGPTLHLLALDLRQRGDGVEPAVLGQRHRDRVERLGEGPHGVLLQAGSLDRCVLDREGTGDLGSAPAVDDPVIADEVPHDTEGVVEGTLCLVDDLTKLASPRRE